MTVERQKWNQCFRRTYAPRWPCRDCKKGTLKLVKGSMAIAETASSRRDRVYEHKGQEEYEGRFSCLLSCDTCTDPVAVVGYVIYEPEDDGEGGVRWEQCLTPLFIHPPPDLFQIPAKCPKDIANEIRRAFGLFWFDREAAANRTRTAVEFLLNHLKVKKRQKTKRGTSERLSLHQRIEIFQARQPGPGKHLLALTWLGNVGSHPGDLRRDDLFDAFDILSHVLDELMTQRTQRVTQLANQITKRKGPRSARTRRSAH
jgi:hypothetical protein